VTREAETGEVLSFYGTIEVRAMTGIFVYMGSASLDFDDFFQFYLFPPKGPEVSLFAP
jgi:hypothetical protein